MCYGYNITFAFAVNIPGYEQTVFWYERLILRKTNNFEHEKEPV